MSFLSVYCNLAWNCALGPIDVHKNICSCLVVPLSQEANLFLSGSLGIRRIASNLNGFSFNQPVKFEW